MRRPAGFADIAIHVPLDEVDGVLAEQLVEHADKVILHIGAPDVEHRLVAPERLFAAREMDDPVGVGAIEIGVRIDHLGLDPYAEFHALAVDEVGERREALGEFDLVGPPVAEPGAIVISPMKPAIVDDEELDAHRGGLVGNRRLPLDRDVEQRRVPGVVDDGRHVVRPR